MPAESKDASIDDLDLPKTVIQRIAKTALPSNISLAKDAKLALTKASTVFISFLTATALDLTNKKSLKPEDIMKALQEMEFTEFLKDVEEAYAKHSEQQQKKKEIAKAKKEAQLEESGDASMKRTAEEDGEDLNNKRIKQEQIENEDVEVNEIEEEEDQSD